MRQATVNSVGRHGRAAVDDPGGSDDGGLDRHAGALVRDHVARGGASVAANATVTITGTAVDSGGGQVGGVEVSVDGGATWHRAAGRERLDLLLADGQRPHGDAHEPCR